MNRRGFFATMGAATVFSVLPRPRLPVYEAPTLTPLGSIYNPKVMAAIQEATLRRVYRDSLSPKIPLPAWRVAA